MGEVKLRGKFKGNQFWKAMKQEIEKKLKNKGVLDDWDVEIIPNENPDDNIASAEMENRKITIRFNRELADKLVECFTRINVITPIDCLFDYKPFYGMIGPYSFNPEDEDSLDEEEEVIEEVKLNPDVPPYVWGVDYHVCIGNPE